MADKDKHFTFRNRQVPQEYWNMTMEQKREWAKSFLESLSPNSEVRERSSKKKK